MKISITNESPQVSNEQYHMILNALHEQAYQYADMADVRMPVLYSSKRPDAFPIVILQNADVAKALGYHTVDKDGKPYGKVFTDIILKNGGTVLGEKGNPAFSVSACASHELWETIGDPPCGWWWDNGTFSVAAELADPTQGDAYKTSNGVAMSNVIIAQRWANPYAKTGPFDLMNLCRKPFELRKNGYYVKMTDNGSQPVFADEMEDEFHLLVETKEAFQGSRTFKRLEAEPDQG